MITHLLKPSGMDDIGKSLQTQDSSSLYGSMTHGLPTHGLPRLWGGDFSVSGHGQNNIVSHSGSVFASLPHFKIGSKNSDHGDSKNHTDNDSNNNNEGKSNNATASSSRHLGPKLASNVIEIVTEMVDAIELSIWDAVVDRVG